MTTLEELEKRYLVWLTSEDEDDAFAFAGACGNALPGLIESARRVEELEAANREMNRLLRLYSVQHGTVTET